MSLQAVKYCPLCDYENLSVASFCTHCDGDLMHAPLESRREAETVSVQEVATQRVDSKATEPIETLQLILVADPAIHFEVRPDQTVGRASKADVVLSGVPEIEYISRAHARFTKRRKQWYVQYIAAGNSITVDGVESSDQSELAIYDESVVLLSFTPFRIKVN